MTNPTEWTVPVEPKPLEIPEDIDTSALEESYQLFLDTTSDA